jgi:hypothetical protein
VIITHDQDFLRLNDRWQEAGKRHGGIIFVSRHLQGKRHVGILINTIQEYHELIEAGAGTVAEDIENQVIFIS